MAERRASGGPRRQLASLMPLVGAWAVAGLVLSGVAAQRSVPVERLFLDAAYLTHEPWYTGVLSSVGILLWTSAVVAALGGSWVARQTGRPTAARFLRDGAAVTAVLLADDLFEFHAVLLQRTGLPKIVRELLVVAPALWWLVRYVREIARTRWIILGFALAGFATSVGIDALGSESSLSLFGEDGAKLLAVLAFAQYLVLTTVDITRSTIRAATGASSAPSPSLGAAPGASSAVAAGGASATVGPAPV